MLGILHSTVKCRNCGRMRFFWSLESISRFLSIIVGDFGDHLQVFGA